MTFLPAQSARALLLMQKAQVEQQLELLGFQQQVVMSEVNAIENKYAQMSFEGTEVQMSAYDEARQKLLDRQSEYLQEQEESLNGEEEIISQELQALLNFVKNGIKESVGLQIMGGS